MSTDNSNTINADDARVIAAYESAANAYRAMWEARLALVRAMRLAAVHGVTDTPPGPPPAETPPPPEGETPPPPDEAPAPEGAGATKPPTVDYATHRRTLGPGTESPTLVSTHSPDVLRHALLAGSSGGFVVVIHDDQHWSNTRPTVVAWPGYDTLRGVTGRAVLNCDGHGVMRNRVDLWSNVQARDLARVLRESGVTI